MQVVETGACGGSGLQAPFLWMEAEGVKERAFWEAAAWLSLQDDPGSSAGACAARSGRRRRHLSVWVLRRGGRR